MSILSALDGAIGGARSQDLVQRVRLSERPIYGMIRRRDKEDDRMFRRDRCGAANMHPERLNADGHVGRSNAPGGAVALLYLALLIAGCGRGAATEPLRGPTVPPSPIPSVSPTHTAAPTDVPTATPPPTATTFPTTSATRDIAALRAAFEPTRVAGEIAAPSETPVLSATSALATTSTPTPYAGEPAADFWNEVPIMPGARGRRDRGDTYTYTVSASAEEVVAFYKDQMVDQGWRSTSEVTTDDESFRMLVFEKDDVNIGVSITVMAARLSFVSLGLY